MIGFKYQIKIKSEKHYLEIIKSLKSLGFKWFFEEHIPSNFESILVMRKKVFKKEEKLFTRGCSTENIPFKELNYFKENYNGKY